VGAKTITKTKSKTNLKLKNTDQRWAKY